MRVVNGHIAKSHPGEAESAQCAGTALIDVGMNIVISARVCNQDIVFGDSVQTIKVIEVGTSTTDKAISAIGKNLNNIGVVSLDSLFCPYVIGLNWENDAVLPYWEEPSDSGINSTNLNPFNPNKSMVDANKYFNEGPNLGFYNNTKSVGPDSVDDLWQYGNIRRRETIDLDKIRSVGFKAPIILTGWGYDTGGKPVPADTGNPDIFASGAFRDPSLWKSGPLDARWDDQRKVWSAGGSSTKVFLSKVTNTYNPSNFSYEVDRSYNRAQYSRNAPQNQMDFSSSGTIYDPEYLAYSRNPSNTGTYEILNYTDIDFPHYEAFIIRETIDDVGQNYYNIWSEDCQDCGHVSNPCNSGENSTLGFHGASSVGKKILIENPLKQNLDTGDLCFTMKTGRSKNVNTGSFVGGSGVGASGNVVTNSSGVASFQITNSGSGYIYGGFGLMNSGVCIGVDLTFSGGQLSGGTITPNTGLPRSASYEVSVYPANATAQTESLDIHWIMQAEFKSQQVITHVECDGGLMQTCSVKIQTQGFKTCEWCGEDTTLINSF